MTDDQHAKEIFDALAELKRTMYQAEKDGLKFEPSPFVLKVRMYRNYVREEKPT